MHFRSRADPLWLPSLNICRPKLLGQAGATVSSHHFWVRLCHWHIYRRPIVCILNVHSNHCLRSDNCSTGLETAMINFTKNLYHSLYPYIDVHLHVILIYFCLFLMSFFKEILVLMSVLFTVLAFFLMILLLFLNTSLYFLGYGTMCTKSKVSKHLSNSCIDFCLQRLIGLLQRANVHWKLSVSQRPRRAFPSISTSLPPVVISWKLSLHFLLSDRLSSTTAETQASWPISICNLLRTWKSV